MSNDYLLDVSEFEARRFYPLLERPEGFLAIPAAINHDMAVTTFNYINIGRP
jgi:hypothetical protein